MTTPSSNLPEGVPNLNSPPGAPIPNAPPSSQNTRPITTSPTTSAQPASQLTSATARVPDNPQTQQYRKFIYYSSIGVTVAAPIIVLLPPRKFDLYTFGLGVTWCVSTGFVLEERTGKGLLWHVGSRLPSHANKERREREKLEKVETERREKRGDGGVNLSDMAREDAKVRKGLSGQQAKGSLVEQVKEQEAMRQREEQAKSADGKEEPRGVIKKIWMGDEKDNYLEDRATKEEKALEAGRGYGGLIGDYVREAFGYKTSSEDEDEQDAEVAEKMREKYGRKKGSE